MLGAGRIGKVHARAVGGNSEARLAAVADAFDDAARAIADVHGCEVASIDKIAADANIDGVIICTPTDTHADLIEQFARAGKAIFCEKPIDLDVKRVEQCLAVVEECGIGQLMVDAVSKRDVPVIQACGLVFAMVFVVLGSATPSLAK